MKHLQTLAVAALLALGAGTASAASCTSSFNLGSMGPPATKSFGNSFAPGLNQFSDCYSFTIAAPANANGTTTEIDALYNTRFGFSFVTNLIDVLGVSLSHDDAGNKSAVGSWDLTPSSFSFSNLSAGAYQLVVAGYNLGYAGTASYTGTLSTSAVAAPVPEPDVMALMGLAVAGAAFAARRRRSV